MADEDTTQETTAKAETKTAKHAESDKDVGEADVENTDGHDEEGK